MTSILSPQDLNATSFNGFSAAALPAASLFGNNATSMIGYPSDSSLFSNETVASSQGSKAGVGDLAGFSSAWGENPNAATASQSGLYSGSALPPALENMYQMALSSALMKTMTELMGAMCGLNGLNKAQDSATLDGAQGGQGGINGGLDGNTDGVNGAAGKDGAGGTPIVPKGGTLSGKQLVDVLKQAGFTGEGLKMAWAIAMRESGGKPSAFNGNAGTGDKSYGLFQINMLGNLGPARLKELGLNSNEDLLDPLANAKAAFKMSKGGTDFGAWAVGPNAYRRSASLDAAIQKYLKEFPG